MPKNNEKILYIGDNLPIMLGMESDMVDLIYTDPPFKTETFRKGKTEKHSFTDTWSDVQVDFAHAINLKFQYPEMWRMICLAERIHSPAMHSYLAFMAPRLVQIHRILKPTGSLYLHCDPNANSYLRMLLDCVFGENNMRNEIIWHYKTSSSKSDKHFIKNTDSIWLYAKSKRHTINVQKEPWTDKTLVKWQTDDAGRIYRTNAGKRYYIDPEGKRMDNVWNITLSSRSKERTGYNSQKPLALVNRVIKASSNEGDLVMDPFCGCATTCMSAAGLRRRWIGIDQNEEAIAIFRDRLAGDLTTFAFDTNMPADAKLQKPIAIPKRKVSGYEKISKKKAKLILVRADYGTYNHTFCKGCLDKIDEKHLTVDHILAQNKGGLDEIENLQLLCTTCNSKKGTNDMDFLYRVLDDEKRQLRNQIRKERDLLTK